MPSDEIIIKRKSVVIMDTVIYCGMKNCLAYDVVCIIYRLYIENIRLAIRRCNGFL